MELERQYKVCNFGLKAEIRWSQQAKRNPLVAQAKWGDLLVSQAKERDLLVTQEDLSAPRVCSPAVALLHKKCPPPQKKDKCELSLTVFLLHKIVAVEEWKYKLYFYISTSFSLFAVQYTTQSGPSCLEYESLLADCNISTELLTETREQDRVKDNRCCIEMLKVSFVKDERSKHRLHCFIPSLPQGRIVPWTRIFPTQNRPSASDSELTRLTD